MPGRRTPLLLAAVTTASVLAAAPAAATAAATEDEPELVTPSQVSRTVPADLSPFILDLDVQVRDDAWPASGG